MKKAPEVLDPLLSIIVENCITIKNLLENDLSDRRCDTVFTEHMVCRVSLCDHLLTCAQGPADIRPEHNGHHWSQYLLHSGTCTTNHHIRWSNDVISEAGVSSTCYCATICHWWALWWWHHIPSAPSSATTSVTSGCPIARISSTSWCPQFAQSIRNLSIKSWARLSVVGAADCNKCIVIRSPMSRSGWAVLQSGQWTWNSGACCHRECCRSSSRTTLHWIVSMIVHRNYRLLIFYVHRWCSWNSWPQYSGKIDRSIIR